MTVLSIRSIYLHRNYPNPYFRYVPNPTKVLADLWQKGHEYPEMVSGKIVAGDAVELDVLTLPVGGLLPDLPTIPGIVPPLGNS